MPTHPDPDAPRATGGRLPHDMRRVHHYDRTTIVMPNGKTMCSYTPIFEEDDDAAAVR